MGAAILGIGPYRGSTRITSGGAWLVGTDPAGISDRRAWIEKTVKLHDVCRHKHSHGNSALRMAVSYAGVCRDDTACETLPVSLHTVRMHGRHPERDQGQLRSARWIGITCKERFTR